jgi:cysteine desulfurase family protein
VSHDNTVYLDFAATSALRPPEVTRAVVEFLEGCGATPGRGGHRRAIEAGRIAVRCRMGLARLLNIPGDPGRIAFMMNATHAINTALWGTLRTGDVVVTTAYDHNAVLRTAHRIAQERNVEVRMLAGAPDGSIDWAEAARALAGARLLVLNAASNVLGTVLPVAELTRLAHDAGALVLVDAAQSAGHLPVDVQAEGVDLVAFTGHKALLGIQGTGGLWVRDGLDVDPFMTGGTGGDSKLRNMPPTYPDHLEAGTLNAPGLAALLAGLDWIHAQGISRIHEHGATLKTRLWDGLSALPDVRVLSPREPEGVPLVTWVPRSMEVPACAKALDKDHGILTRAGLHCAPEVHRLLGSDATGAVRMSLGWCSTEAEVDSALDAVARVTGGKVFSSATLEARPS